MQEPSVIIKQKQYAKQATNVQLLGDVCIYIDDYKWCMSSYKKPSNYTSIPVTCRTSREPLKTSKIDRIQQSP
jgi:hypothetical protein